MPGNEARELLQVTKHHFNTAPLAVRMLYIPWQKTAGVSRRMNASPESPDVTSGDGGEYIDPGLWPQLFAERTSTMRPKDGGTPAREYRGRKPADIYILAAVNKKRGPHPRVASCGGAGYDAWCYVFLILVLLLGERQGHHRAPPTSSAGNDRVRSRVLIVIWEAAGTTLSYQSARAPSRLFFHSEPHSNRHPDYPAHRSIPLSEVYGQTCTIVIV